MKWRDNVPARDSVQWDVMMGEAEVIKVGMVLTWFGSGKARRDHGRGACGGADCELVHG